MDTIMSILKLKLLSTSLSSKFQDFPGPGNFPIKIPGFSRRGGNPGNCNENPL